MFTVSGFVVDFLTESTIIHVKMFVFVFNWSMDTHTSAGVA